MRFLFLLMTVTALTLTAQPFPPMPEDIIGNTATSLSVGLAWDASPDAGESIEGYQVHHGTNAGDYFTNYWAGTNLSLTVSNVPFATTNYFVVTAVGTNQMESEFSNEVLWPAPFPPEPPTLKTKVIVTPEYEISEDGVSWRPAGRGPEVVFDAPDDWKIGFVRARLSFREIAATSP